MILREDMLELTRRMTAARSQLVRLAGAYIDDDALYKHIPESQVFSISNL